MVLPLFLLLVFCVGTKSQTPNSSPPQSKTVEAAVSRETPTQALAASLANMRFSEKATAKVSNNDHERFGSSKTSIVRRFFDFPLHVGKVLVNALGFGDSRKASTRGKSITEQDVTGRAIGRDLSTGLVRLSSPADRWVKVKFEVDGKTVDQEFKVLLYANNQVIEPTITGKNFELPPKLESVQTMKVRFLSGEYDLFFDSVHTTAFDTKWVIGVDKPPFDDENIDSEEPAPFGKKLLIIYYINFVPKNAEGTRLMVKVYE